MKVDPGGSDEGTLQSALSACLAPRPVALVSTVSSAGIPNAAPFSMVTLLSAAPPLVGLAVHPRSDGGRKATLRNIEEVGDFVVNAVTLSLLPAAVESTAGGRAGRPSTGLRFVASDRVRSPRIAGSPIQLECRLSEILRPAGSVVAFVVGAVTRVHVDDALVPGGALEALRPVGHLATPTRGEYLFATVGEIRRFRV